MIGRARLRATHIVHVAEAHRGEAFEIAQLAAWCQREDTQTFRRDLAIARQIALARGWDLSTCVRDYASGRNVMTFQHDTADDITTAAFRRYANTARTYTGKAGQWGTWHAEHGHTARARYVGESVAEIAAVQAGLWKVAERVERALNGTDD